MKTTNSKDLVKVNQILPKGEVDCQVWPGRDCNHTHTTDLFPKIRCLQIFVMYLKGIKQKKSLEISINSLIFSDLHRCRGDRIRTCDHLVPNQVRYRTALRPEKQCKGTHFFAILQIKECKWRQIGGRGKEGKDT